MEKFKKIYPWIAMPVLAVILFIAKIPDFKKTASAITIQERSESVVLLNIEAFEKAFVEDDSFELSGSKFICSPALLEKILQNVDSTALKDVSNKSVTFYKKDGYIEVPANMMTNMIDQGLFKKSDK